MQCLQQTRMQQRHEQPDIDPSLPVLFYRLGDERFANCEQLINFMKTCSPTVRQMIQPWNVAEYKRPRHITHVPTLQIGTKAHVGDHALAWIEGLASFEELAQRVSACAGGVCQVPGGGGVPQGQQQQGQQQEQQHVPLMHGAAPLEETDGPAAVMFEIGKKAGPPSRGPPVQKDVEPARNGRLTEEERARQERLAQHLKQLQKAPVM